MDPTGDRPPSLARSTRAGYRWLHSRFEVDTRSLAALRIALGAILLLDLFHRAGSIRRFYTADGIYPVAVHEAAYGQGGLVSVHALSGAYRVQTLLFLLACLAAVAFLVGYRTRIAGLVSLAFLFSLHVRAPVVLNGGDRLLRVLLFVALLSPLGERWSIDALRGGDRRRTVASLGTAALLVQPLAVFTSNAILKHRGEYWYSGDAVEIALYDTTMATGFGGRLLEFPTLLTVLTYGWVFLLAGSVPLLLFAAGRGRTLAVSAYLSAFAGMALALSVGLFPFVLAASVLPFLPGSVWDGLARRLSIPAAVPDRLRIESLLEAPNGTAIEPRLRLPVESGDRGRFRSRIEAVRRSASPIVAAVVLAWILAFTAVDVADAEPPGPLDSEHLDQQDWGLYAPDPDTSYSWYVTAATLEDGSVIDPRDGGVVSFDRPPDADAYGSFRHRSLMLSVDAASRRDGALAARYAGWACERAEAIADAGVDRVVVYRFLQPKPLAGDYDEPRRTTIVDRRCR
jgi:hypothetical protein